MKTLASASERQTFNIGKKLSKILHGGEILALYGGLGSGKTSFVKGLAAGLGIKQTVNSPTFVIYKQYPFMIGQKVFHLCHFDLYRISKARDLDQLGIGELMKSENNVIVVEWPDAIKKLMKNKAINIHFSYGEKVNQRKIRIPKGCR